MWYNGIVTTSVYIAKSVYGGDGIGRLGDGRVVFVPGAFAGEHVRAEIVEEKRNLVRARLVAVEDASPERRGEGEPPQPGMVYANLTAKGECAAKAAQLEEFFERARIGISGGIAKPPLAGGGEDGMLHYRNKTVYHIDGLKLGYRREPGHEVVDIESDLLACREIDAALPEIRRNVRLMLTQGSRSARRAVEGKSDVTVRWSRRSGVQWWLGDAPKGLTIREELLGKAFDVPADGFWQVNGAGGEALARAVAKHFAEAPTDRLIDLYCGVGSLGIVCGAKKLAGVESGIAATEAARENAKRAGIADAIFLAGRAEACLKRLKPAGETTAIVDPPRGGMERSAATWLARTQAVRRVIYAGCDPATMIRDIKVLAAGGFAVETVEWINMFPRTARFETLAVLERNGAKQ